MLLLRQFDERMLLLQRQGRVGFHGPSKGQEAATIASCAALAEQDWIFPALREAGAALYRGLSLEQMVCQCIGNAGEVTKGRQMPCHHSYRAGHFVAMSSVIGTQLPHAVGAAMAARIRGDDAVVMGYLGDGATSTPEFHAAMNFAAVFRAPCVLVCQNNQWAISLPVARQTATRTIAEKGVAYGMPAERVDGNDALAVYVATRRAVLRARSGEGPTLLELLTYRVLGHASSDDPTRYRDAAEVEAWAAKDPIRRLRRYLEQSHSWTRTEETELSERIAARIARAVTEAFAKPAVPPSSLIEDVYAETPQHLLRQLRDDLP
jgi:pyruvate dehydrogenase E1 component alpha subunit/2-oxoisovalerate dehydrogenase E1 component alpha subunit